MTAAICLLLVALLIAIAQAFVLQSHQTSHAGQQPLRAIRDASSDRAKMISLVKKLSSIPLTTMAYTAYTKIASADDLATATATATAATTAAEYIPQITHKVFLEVKIANYTEESRGTNQGAAGSGRLVIGLFGNDAPKSVKRFLDVINTDGLTHPSFVNAQFSKVSPEGLLEVEKLSGLRVISLAGKEEYEYDGTLMNYEPILETNKISHSKPGLLSRKQLTNGPEFGVTLKPTKELDAFHVVFGTVMEGQNVISALSQIPTYTYTTKMGYGGKSKGSIDGGVSDAWFSAQKTLFVGAGKAFGDMRAVDRRGQLLNRVTIKRAGPIDPM